MIDSGKKQKIIKIVGYAIAVFCLAYIIKKIVDMDIIGELSKHPLKNPPAMVIYVILSSIGFAVIVFISSYAWKKTLEFLYGSKIAFSEIRAVYAKSNIAKYIPAGNFAGRNVLGKKLGFSHIDMALSTVIEIITLIFTACLWSVVFALQSILTAAEIVIKEYSIWPFVVLIAVAVLLAAGLILYAHKKGLWQKYRRLFTLKFLHVFVILFLIYTLTMIIPGVLLVVIFTQGLGVSLSLSSLIIVIAAYMISWVLGYVVPIPGGFGVREAVLLAILNPICGVLFTTIAILLFRLASTLGDVLAFFIELLIERKTMKG
jgi:Uncharacterised protein family (UPF0104).